jgi:hypothetical protein
MQIEMADKVKSLEEHDEMRSEMPNERNCTTAFFPWMLLLLYGMQKLIELLLRDNGIERDKLYVNCTLALSTACWMSGYLRPILVVLSCLFAISHILSKAAKAYLCAGSGVCHVLSGYMSAILS